MNVLLIGATPSSGSSLLMTLLSESERMLCLPETGLFCHGEFLIRAETVDDGFELRRRVPWIDTPEKTAQSLGWKVRFSSESGGGFQSAWQVLEHFLGIDDKRLVVEKCPENVFGFQALLASDPSSRVVVTWRELQGVCESLVARGVNLLEAVLIWFAHSYEIARLIERYRERVLFLPYPDLVSKKGAIVEEILAFALRAEGSDGIGSEEPRQQDAADRSEELYLLNIANWSLEDTSWSRRTSDAVAASTVADVLGLEFEDLVRSTVFRTPEERLVSPSGLNEALRRGARRFSWPAAGEEWGDPVAVRGFYQSAMTECLARHYTPLRVRV